ncbi:hypothetical protein PSAC2689_150014 [Paraburkholderia sacchari]
MSTISAKRFEKHSRATPRLCFFLAGYTVRLSFVHLLFVHEITKGTGHEAVTLPARHAAWPRAIRGGPAAPSRR